MVRRQYSANAHGVIKGIGVVTCMYVNPETDQFWIIDYCIYAPDGEGKSKLAHVLELLGKGIYQKGLPFWEVLMYIWYATTDVMLQIEQYSKTYYYPLKDNRLVDDSGDAQPYRRIDCLNWTKDELQHGKLIKI